MARIRFVFLRFKEICNPKIHIISGGLKAIFFNEVVIVFQKFI